MTAYLVSRPSRLGTSDRGAVTLQWPSRYARHRHDTHVTVTTRTSPSRHARTDSWRRMTLLSAQFNRLNKRTAETPWPAGQTSRQTGSWPGWDTVPYGARKTGSWSGWDTVPYGAAASGVRGL